MFKDFNCILDAVPTSFIIIDTAGIIRYVNKKSLIQLGHQEHELLGENVNILMDEPHHSLHDSYLQNYLETQHSNLINKSRFVEVLRKDKSKFSAELFLGEFSYKKNVFLLGMIYDQQHQENIFRAFNATYQHEINGPLTTAYGQIEALKKNHQNDKAIKKLEESLEKISQVLKKIDKSSEMEFIKYHEQLSFLNIHKKESKSE